LQLDFWQMGQCRVLNKLRGRSKVFWRTLRTRWRGFIRLYSFLFENNIYSFLFDLKLKNVHKRYRAMDSKRKLRYKIMSARAQSFSEDLLGLMRDGTLVKGVRGKKVVSRLPCGRDKPATITTRYTRDPLGRDKTGGSLPARLKPKKNMRSTRSKYLGYVDAQNNMVLLGGKYNPHGVSPLDILKYTNGSK